jgi:16S rRNA (cytosine967-C5)-methyltransferase
VLLDVGAGVRAETSLERRAGRLVGADRALCHEIAFGTLRWKLALDARLDARLAKGLDSLPPPARAILEVAAYQLLFLDRVPAYAVLHDAVDHVRTLLPANQARGLTGVVNATLRALAAEPRPLPGSAADVHSAASPAGPGARPLGVPELAVATSHPAWVVERWVGRFGLERATAILESDNRRPGVHLRPHAGRIGATDLVERLRGEGAQAFPHPLDAGCVVLGGGDPTSFAAYGEGLFSIQDVSAQRISALAADLARGLTVDLCAAPGGKAAAIAERPRGRTIVAADVSPARLLRLAANARRQELPLLVVAADARFPALRRRADFVLADVPCLGTGTFRRRVDARWQKTSAMLPGLVELQHAILLGAADLLAPGGRLLYSTCSLEDEENEDAVSRLVEARPDLALVDLAPWVEAPLRGAVASRPEAVLFVTPERGDCDGAFAALFERIS